MQTLYIRHKMIKKYNNNCMFPKNFHSKFLEFRVFNKFKFENFYWTVLSYTQLEQIIHIYVKSIELQVIYLSPINSIILENIYDFICFLLKYNIRNKLSYGFDCYTHLLKLILCLIERINLRINECEENILTPILNKKNIEQFLCKDALKEFGINETVSHFDEFQNGINYFEYESVCEILYKINLLIFLPYQFVYNNDISIEYHSIMKRLIDYNIKNVNGLESLLSLAFCIKKVDAIFEYNKFESCSYNFPFSLDYVTFLLKLGADPNGLLDKKEKNSFINFAIHEYKLLGSEYGYIDSSKRRTLFNTFIEYGAHHDSVNEKGRTLLDIKEYDKEIIIFFNKRLSLQCLAAKVIKQFRLDYDFLPKKLKKFIEIH